MVLITSWKFPLFILVLTSLVDILNSATLDPKYSANLSVDTRRIQCQMAQFSVHQNYSISGRLLVLPHGEDLCSGRFSSSLNEIASSQTSKLSMPVIPAVMRGGCSFEEKAKAAMKLGFQSLIIVNIDDTVMPPGSQDSSYLCEIPVVMVGKNWLDGNFSCALTSSNSICDTAVKLQYDGAPPKSIPKRTSNLMTVSNILGTICIAIFLSLAIQPFASKQYCNLSCSVLLIGVFLSFVSLRIATLRSLPLTPDGLTAYNHNETDERIFETLISSVLKDWRDYRLPEEFIHKFRLANENYGDSLFIHPPIFVFLSAALSAIFSIPLPLCSVVYAAGTLLSIPFIILHSGLIEKQQQMSLILWSVVVYSFCPISMFVSQKFWIDNCLTLMVTFSMGIHLFLNNFKASTWIRQSLMAEFVSGLVFGIIALNCKVTAAASLPSMVLWIARSRFLFHLDKFRIFNHDCNESTGLTSQISDKLLQYPRRFQNFWSQFWQIIFDTFGHVLIFLVGAMCGHSPWVYLYWSHTGRILPNAWPSAEMVAKSRFLQLAISKSPWTYASTLVSIAPAQVIGLLFAIWQALQVARFLLTTRKSNLHMIAYSDFFRCQLSLIIFLLWPLSYIISLSILGWLGAGFQSRFLTPALPACAILTALSFTRRHSDQDFNRDIAINQVAYVAGVILLVYSSFHCLYYGVMFSPLYADLDANAFQIIGTILSSPYYPPSTRDEMIAVFKYTSHFGLSLKVS